jgi:hypothetical protein
MNCNFNVLESPNFTGFSFGKTYKMSHLTNEQQGMVQVFQEVAQINDEYLCIQILQQNNWYLQYYNLMNLSVL